MSTLSMLNILSPSSLRRKVLALMLVLVVSISGMSAQTTAITRLYNPPAFQPLIDNVLLCAIATEDFNVRVEFSRLAGDFSWVDANVEWILPTGPGGVQLWSVSPTTTRDAFFEVITFHLEVDPNIPMLREFQIGGNFIARRVVGGSTTDTAIINLPIRPAARVVTTIFMDSIFCEGADVRAWIYRRQPGSNPLLDAFYDDMLFRWNVLNAYGVSVANNTGNTSPGTDWAVGDTSFLIRNFDPEIHRTVTVERTFCHPTGFLMPGNNFDTPEVDATIRDFAEDPDLIVISNPPLDTTANNEFGVRQDTLYRLEWSSVTTKIPNPAFPDPDGLEPDSIYLVLSSWVPIPMRGDDNASGGNLFPVCVNYGTPSFFAPNVVVPGAQDLSVPAGFEAQRAEHSPGYLFFQVGNDMDTLVDYIWYYDTVFLERVFVGVPIQVGGGAPFNWWGAANNQRWTTRTYFPGMPELTNENSLVDPLTQANFGWFGRPYPAGNPNTFRAAFRVRALDEADFPTTEDYRAARRQPITVGVRPVCRFCPQIPDAIPFQNDSLSGNVGRAWDTIRPFTDFDILIVENTTWNSYPTLALDTACQGVQVNFQLMSTEGTTFSWRRDHFAEQYNITAFAGHGFSGVIPALGNPNIHTHSQWSSTAPDALAQITGTANPTIPPVGGQLFAPFMRTFTPRNHCFVRRAPTLTLVDNPTTNERDSIVFANLNDTLWHRAIPFWTERLASEPHIWDSTLNRRLNPITHINPDTIFICRSQILNAASDGFVGYGLTYTLLTTRGENNRLMRNPRTDDDNPVYWGAALREVFPPQYYHGFFNEPIGIGNPASEGIRTDFISSSEIDHPLYTFQTTFAIRPEHFATLEAGSSGTLMFAAQTRCGRGVAATITYFILDTVSASPDLMYSFTHPGEQIEVFDNLQEEYICAWTSMFFYVADSTNLVRRRQAMRWWVPDVWDSIREVTIIGENPMRGVEVGFSEDIGRVGVNIVNRCGGSRVVYTPTIEPIPYFRTADDWINFTICQGETLRFEFKEVEEDLMDTLFIVFPGDPNTNWSVVGNSAFGNAWAPYGKGRRDTLAHDDLFPHVGAMLPHRTSRVYFDALVNDSVGGHQEILISWEFAACAGQRDRYWDTVQIFTNTFPSMPQTAESWDKHMYDGPSGYYFTFCLRDTVWLSVNPAPKDTIQENSYFWSFPTGWSLHEWGPRGPNSDSVRVVVGLLGIDGLGHRLEVDTIRVEARSAVCNVDDGALHAARREFSTLRVPVRVMDTIVFDIAFVRNAANDDALIDPKPCVDTELKLFVRQPYSYDSVRWHWGDSWSNLGNDVSSAPNIFDGWEFVDVDLLPDTFAVVPRSGTTASLYARATLYNRCGASRSDTIRLIVADYIADDTRVIFNEPINTTLENNFSLCEGESVRFSVNPVPDAGQYVWNFPWYPFRDTVLEYSRELTPTAIGPIWVIAINACSESTYSDTIRITYILEAPQAPIIHNFAAGGHLTILGQTFALTDTVCLRQQTSDWRIGLDPVDVEYTGGWYAFDWTVFGTGGSGIATDINEFFEFIPSTLDSAFNTHPADATVPAGIFEILIGVAAVRERCPTAPGDTLRILLTVVDTIPIAEIAGWHGIAMNGDSYPTWPQPCADDIITLSVENDVALGYRWILPADDYTWEFVDDDRTSGSVQIRVGHYPARIGVITTTRRGEGVYFCGENFANQDTLWSHEIRPFSGPILTGFSSGFPTDVCAESGNIGIMVELDPDHNLFDELRFTIDRHRALYIDSTEREVLYETNPILVIPALGDWLYDSITVMVHAINHSRCPDLPAKVSDSIVRTFRVFNSPRVFVRGVMHPCRNVIQEYTIELSDPLVTFTFAYQAFAADLASLSTVEIFPETGQPDSIVVTTFLGDSVQFIFSNISTASCVFPDFEDTDTITIVMNTALAGGFVFEIRYHEFVCRNVDGFSLEIINVGASQIDFAREWFRYRLDTTFITIGDEEVIDRVDTVLLPLGSTSSTVSILQSEFADENVREMNFAVVAVYELCYEGVIEYTADTIFFTVTIVEPIVARIDASVVRIVGNRADVIRPFNQGFDSVLLGQNLRFIGTAEGREPNHPHLIFEWWGDFDNERWAYGPSPTNSDTVFSGTIFFDEQVFFFGVYDTIAYGCYSYTYIYVFIHEFTGSSIDDANVFGDVPNAFTPHNQDGINDIFMSGVDRITILNRWGVVIYHAEGARAREGWDGRDSRTNRMVDRGDYFFIIEIHRPNVTNSNEPPYTHSKTGVVTVL